MKLMNSIVALSVLSAGFSAHAATYAELYSCFNQGQLVDAAPIVSIVEDQNHVQYVEVQTMASTRYIRLRAQRAMILDGSVLEGTGVQVVERNGVENPGTAGATVTLTASNLTYECAPFGVAQAN